MTDTPPEPFPDRVVLLALTLCLVLTFALAYQVRPNSWYFERQPTPGQTLASVMEPLAGGSFPTFLLLAQSSRSEQEVDHDSGVIDLWP